MSVLRRHHAHRPENRADGGTNDRSNLILTCTSCHDKIHAGLITLSDVLKAKAAMRRDAAPARKPRPDTALPSNVVLYLIKRYQTFKEADVKSGMKHAIIYKSIEREFGCTWEFVPLLRFDELVEFLQRRIDDTKLGRNQRARGTRRYSTYPEYLSGHRY